MSSLYPYISPHAEGIDVYNFSIPYPYADTVNTLQRQMIFNNSVVFEVRSTIGTASSGATGSNTIDVLSEGLPLVSLGESHTYNDLNVLADEVSIKTLFTSGTDLIAGNYLGIKVSSLKTGGSGTYQDLLVQVIARKV